MPLNDGNSMIKEYPMSLDNEYHKNIIYLHICNTNIQINFHSRYGCVDMTGKEMAMGFSAGLSNDGHELKISIAGRFDFNMHSDFRNSYRKLPSSTQFVIDLSQATFMDSSAMGMLLLLREHAGDAKANIRLQNCNNEVRKILSISNLDKMFIVE